MLAIPYSVSFFNCPVSHSSLQKTVTFFYPVLWHVSPSYCFTDQT